MEIDDAGFVSMLPKKFSPPIFSLPETIWSPAIEPANLYPIGSSESAQLRKLYWALNGEGYVFLSFRAAYDVKCSMDFEDMPFDEQICHVDMAATQPATKISLATFPMDYMDWLRDPDMLSAMSSKGWTCTEIYVETGTSSPPGAGSARTEAATNALATQHIKIYYKFKRVSGWYMQNVLTPAVLLVLISWASFFISRAAVPARVAMGVICYLNISNLANSVMGTLPKVSSAVRLVDLLLRSKYFVLYSILEYCLANFLMRVEKRVEKAVEKAEKEAAAAKAKAAQAGATTYGSTLTAEEMKKEVSAGVQVEAEMLATRGAASGEAAGPFASEGGSAEIQAEMIAEGEIVPKFSSPPGKRVSAVSLFGSQAKKEAAVRKHLRGPELVFTNSHGKMWIRDQHLDVASRYLYPIAYIIVLGVFYG
jgi:hypothetical protein